MILPTKHISPAESLLGIGALVLQHLDRPQTVTHVWEGVRRESNVPSFQRFVLALDLLYTVSAVDLNDGLLRRRES